VRNLASPSTVRSLLAQLDVHPSRRLGQNFLVDRNILGILVEAAGLAAGDQVLEVGPGLGVVTRELLGIARRVVAVEKDARLCDFLRAELGDAAGLELRHADALDLDAEELFGSGINVVVANLPYSVGSRILADFVTCGRRPERMVLTLQKEVADRLAAPPGDAACGLLGVWTQHAYAVTRVKTVSPGCFWPRPEVGSAIVKLKRRDAAPGTRTEEEFFRRVTKAAFSRRRKQLAAVLPRVLGPACDAAACRVALAQAGVDPASRPGDLDADRWWTLCGCLARTA